MGNLMRSKGQFKRVKGVLLPANDPMFSEGPTAFIPWRPKPKKKKSANDKEENNMGKVTDLGSYKPGEKLPEAGVFIPRPKKKRKRLEIVLAKANDPMFSEGPSVAVPYVKKCRWSTIKPGEPLPKSGFFRPWRPKPKNKPAK